MNELIKQISAITNAHILAHRPEGPYEVIHVLTYLLAANLYPLKDYDTVMHVIDRVVELATAEDPPFRIVDVSAFDGLTEQ